jgi:hypothetical protein
MVMKKYIKRGKRAFSSSKLLSVLKSKYNVLKIFEELHLHTSGLGSVITMNNNYTDVSRHMLRKADELHVHCTYSLIQKVTWNFKNG